MNYKIFAIKDTKVGFMQPFIQPNVVVAQREFANIVNSNGSSVVSQNYKDMELYCLGEYNSISGEIDPQVEFICNGLNVKEVTPNEV